MPAYIKVCRAFWACLLFKREQAEETVERCQDIFFNMEEKAKPGFSFNKSCRLRKSREYDFVFQGRKKDFGRYFGLYWRRRIEYPSDIRAGARLGIVVSKKVGNAVRRNRMKRMIKETFRINRQSIQPFLDTVVVVRAGAGDKDIHLLKDDLLRLFQLIGKK